MMGQEKEVPEVLSETIFPARRVLTGEDCPRAHFGEFSLPS